MSVFSRLVERVRGEADFKITARRGSIKVEGSREDMRFYASRVLPPELAKQYDIAPPMSFVQPVPGQKVPPGSGLAFVFSPYQEFYTKLYGVIQIADLTKYRLMYRTQPDVMARVNKRVLLSIGKGFTVECDNPDGDKAAQFLEKWSRDMDLLTIFWSIGTDMLVYGNAFLELIWDQMQTMQVDIDPAAQRDTAEAMQAPKRPWVEEQTLCPKCKQQTLYMIRYVDNYTFYGDFKAAASWKCTNPLCEGASEEKLFEGTKDGRSIEEILDARYTAQAPQNVDPRVGQPNQQMPRTPLKIDVTGPREVDETDDTGKVLNPRATTIVNLKGLDPLYMRVRADAFGNVFGYYQWLNYPPVLLNSTSVLHFRWNPQTWGYETIYGTSILMPLIRYWDMRTQFENDSAVWFHTYGKPMIHVKGGTPEQPYNAAEMQALSNLFKKRKSGSDVLTKGNVTVEMLQSAAGKGSTQFVTDWLNYLQSRFKESLGVPDAIMGQTGAGGSNRSTATVALEDMIVEAENLQNRIARPFEQNVFPALLKANGFEAVAMLEYRIIFKPIFEEDPNTRSQRIIQERTACIISINEARDQIPDLGSIDQSDTERYKPELDDPTFPVPKAAGGGFGGQEPAGTLGPTSISPGGGGGIQEQPGIQAMVVTSGKGKRIENIQL